VLNAPTNDPQLIGPEMRLIAALYRSVLIRMANAGNPSAAGTARLYWQRTDDTDFAEDRTVSISVGNGGGWKEYSFDVAGNTNWNGEIKRLRLDPVLYGDGHSVGVDYIRPVVDSIPVSNIPVLGLDSVSRTLFWNSYPYQQYTLQYSTSLTSGTWSTLNGFSQQLSDSPMMQYSPTNADTSGSMFYRLEILPGP
jgi:hypothetical protein